MTNNNNTYFEKKHKLVKKAVDDHKSITIIGSGNDNSKPLAFDSQAKYDKYRKSMEVRKR